MSDYKPSGKVLIDGAWVDGGQVFQSKPIEGEAFSFENTSLEHVDQAAKAAKRAYESYRQTPREERAEFLRKIADEIDARGSKITQIGTQETGLPVARLEGERGRTTGQLRLFASHILAGDYLDLRHDKAMPERQPLPRPELYMMQQPIGPVAVFGASNFPLAFSTAGGDTASALAAGCPVIVKGHPAHPGTGEIVAEAILAAINACGLDKAVFQFLPSNQNDVAAALVSHPLIEAVGFTGSLGAGRALFDLCASRAKPIPFYGELGSVNPVFLFGGALQSRGKDLAKAWAASLTMGAGQFCTNPGVLILQDGNEAEEFLNTVQEAINAASPQYMLTDDIYSGYEAGKAKVAQNHAVKTVTASTCENRKAKGDIFRVSGRDFASDPTLAHEVFGPLGIAVLAKDVTEMLDLAKGFEGQLTSTLLIDEEDYQVAQAFVPVLAQISGRVLANGFPTGVEVADAMVHSGPYPASTNFGATSVGTMAIRRFLRPVCYQNIPKALLPRDITGAKSF